MRLQTCVLIILATFCLIATCYASNEGTTEQEQVDKPAGRASLALPKIFDFERFKSIFKKRYGSFSEELARKKLFLARAFEAFLSFVSYKHYRSSSFEKLHEMSDSTQEELRAMEMYRDDAGFDLHDEPVADLGEIEQKLREIVEKRAEEPGYKEIASELTNSEARRKREIGSSARSSLVIDYLLQEPEIEKPSPKAVRRIPSNNPSYSVPELTSYGSELESDRLEEWKSKQIDDLPSQSFLDTLVSGATSLFSDFKKPPAEHEDVIHIDHRTSNCFTPVKNQRSCGSCYIFSTTALYEYMHCKETGQLVPFSEQYALDCGDRIGMEGCKGGFERDVANFYGVYGVELLNNYPYHPRADSCPYESKARVSKMGYLRLKERGLKSIWHSEMEKYIEKGPIIKGLAVSDRFHHYGGGVDSGKGCDPKRRHSMLIVGSGTEDGVDYWLFRNSYGPSWGVNGHYKIAKDAQCFGRGYVLEATYEDSVFGSKNPFNDGTEVEKRKNESPFRRFFDRIMKPSSNDPNMVTPPSH